MSTVRGSDLLNKDLLVKINKFVLLLSLFIIGFLALLFKESKHLIMGYIFGALISILSLHLMNDSVNRFVTMKPNKAKGYAFASYFIRQLIYAVVLIVSAMADYLNLLTAVLGLFMVKISIVLLYILDKDFNR